MFKDTKRFLIGSFSFFIVLCIVVFGLTIMRMSRKSGDAIDDIGMIYMTEMDRQLQEKYNTVIHLRLSQTEGIVKRTPPELVSYGPEMLEELALNASVREFTYLGLYAEDGTCETVFGEALQPFSPEITEALHNREIKVSSGESLSGERLLLMIQPAEYEMKEDHKSSFLISGIPMEELNKALFLGENDSLVYSHIIGKDGSYVVRNGDAFRDSYFSRMREMLVPLDGKEPEVYVRELQEAMETGSDYAVPIQENDIHGHIYCSPLLYSEWYLITVMPYGVLDDAVNTLGRQRLNTMFFSCAVLIVAILGIFAIYYKISRDQIRALDHARWEADHANRAKSEFLSNMSHDIRTPMNGIVGMTTIALNNIDDIERVKDCLRKITLSSKHLLGLINDVLDMSKIESGKMVLNMDLVSLRDTMDSIMSIMRPQVKAKNQHFDIFISGIVAEDIYCDSVRLNQVLINLLSNAVKFTPENGRITVSLSQELSPRGGTYVRCHFRVKDNGIGISEEFQKKIFDTFTREKNAQVNKTEGSGLGMAITKHIVEAMQGTLELNSEVGEGSEFHIVLDFERAPAKGSEMELPPWRVLVVDNNEDLCYSAATELREIGVHPECSLSGREAVEMAKRRHNEKDDYDIALIDWKMPDMDGLETTRRVRECLGPDKPILIISAYDWSDIKEEALGAGANGFISKPLFQSNLYLGLRQYAEHLNTAQEAGDSIQEDFSGKHILLSEDNDLNWEIANELLSAEGFLIERAENGKICVEKFEQSQPGTYDVILMDLRMPVMNGYEAAVAIRALNRPDAALPIIAMTADAFSEDIQHCLDCGMNAHISKPIDVNKLIYELRKYLK